MDISSVFSKQGRPNPRALMPYLCLGDPSPDESLALAKAVAASGADVIELGLPFSDPIADGPVIQAASQRALDAGMNTDIYFELAGDLHKTHPQVALLSMTYYNLLLQYGLEKYCKSCVAAEISGLIIPDLPHEEEGPLKKECDKQNISLIPLITPTTPKARIKEICKTASGFIYLVGLKGVTGARDNLSTDLKSLLGEVRKHTDLPICLGFGVSKPEHVAQAVKMGFDGVIVGSALVGRIEKNLGNTLKMHHEVISYIKELKGQTLH